MSKNGYPLTVSVVTPNYNGAEHLQDCLSSVLSQRKAGLEYIVVDGNSTDSSKQILEQYRGLIDELIIEPDDGHANALNKGFAAASGDILCWLNSDDILFRDTLDFVTDLFDRRPDINWITGRATTINAGGHIVAMEPARPWSRLRFLAGDHFWIQQESTFWRRSLWDAAGGQLDETLDLANDFELWARFFQYSELHTVNRHLGGFRIRPGQRSVEFKQKYLAEAASVLTRELASLSPRQRTGLASIIPSTPRTLTPRQRNALEPDLQKMDPPIVDPLRIAEPASMPLSDSHVDLLELFSKSDLAAFKDRHLGDRCFIIGNGPSLTDTDLSLLEGEIIFGCNLLHLLLDKVDWKPTYYTCVDSMMLTQSPHEINSMLRDNPGVTAFFPTRIEMHTGDRSRVPTRALYPEDSKRFYFEERHSTYDNPPHSLFSSDADEWVAQPYTVTITMLQLAAYMGFKEIFLVGCDTRYRLPESVRILSEAEGPAGLQLTSTADDDPNHFTSNYFGSGTHWHAPNLPMIFEQYRCAKEVIEGRGQRVFNATKGGDLDVFTRVPLEHVFDQKHMEVARQQASHDAAPSTRARHRSAPSPSRISTSQRFLALTRPLSHNKSLVALLVLIAAATLGATFFVPSWTAAAILLLAGAFASLASLCLALAIKVRRILLGALDRQNRMAAILAQTEIQLTEKDQSQANCEVP